MTPDRTTKRRMEWLFDLPTELLSNELLPRLDLASLLAFSSACSRFYRLASNEKSLERYLKRVSPEQLAVYLINAARSGNVIMATLIWQLSGATIDPKSVTSALFLFMGRSDSAVRSLPNKMIEKSFYNPWHITELCVVLETVIRIYLDEDDLSFGCKLFHASIKTKYADYLPIIAEMIIERFDRRRLWKSLMKQQNEIFSHGCYSFLLSCVVEILRSASVDELRTLMQGVDRNLIPDFLRSLCLKLPITRISEINRLLAEIKRTDLNND